MTIDELKEKGWIIMDAVVGSQSYGLATETSDVDTRGVFIIPMNYRISYEYFDQVADEQNNHVYWELGKFIELLNKANPSALEFLNSAEKHIITGATWFEYFKQYDWLSLQCRDTFVKYAQGQLQRAYGLNKKVFEPQPEEAPKVLDYCWIIDNTLGAIPVRTWLSRQDSNDQKEYALTAIDHIDMSYYVYYQDIAADKRNNRDNPEHTWRWAYGIVSDELANDVQLSSIPKGIEPCGVMTFNRNAYSHACKKHTEYWQWVKLRNEERYSATMQQGKGYDAKNVMHCIRLLMTAQDIATKGVVTVDRTKDRDFLFKIKHAEYTYDEVVQMGNDMVEKVIELFKYANLKPTGFKPNELDKILREALLWSRDQKNWMVR